MESKAVQGYEVDGIACHLLQQHSAVVVNRQEDVTAMIEVGAVVVTEAAQKDPADAVLKKEDAAAHTDKAWVVGQAA